MAQRARARSGCRARAHGSETEVGVLAVEEESLVEAAQGLEVGAANEQAGPESQSGEPCTRYVRGTLIISSVQAALGSSRWMKSATANVERARGNRRWEKSRPPSSSRIRGPTAPMPGSRSRIRAMCSTDARIDARVGVQEEDVRCPPARQPALQP